MLLVLAGGVSSTRQPLSTKNKHFRLGYLTVLTMDEERLGTVKVLYRHGSLLNLT